GAGLGAVLDDLCARAARAVADGCTVLFLSDRGVDDGHVPIPSLLATAAVHHHLIREGTRMRCGLVVESGEPREIQHFCLLLGYAAGAVNPYLAFETLRDMVAEGILKDVDGAAAASTTPTTRPRSPSSSTPSAPPASRCSRSTPRR